MPRLSVLLVISLLAAGEGGCVPSEAEQRVASARHDEAAGVRFIEVLTGGASATEALPLVVVLHGFGGRPEAIVNAPGSRRSRCARA